MLTLYHGGQEHPIDNTEYYIRELSSGLDEVIFDISIWDPIYQLIAEEDNIVDRAGQTYLVKQIDAGAVTAKIICQLDLDAWRATLSVGYNSGSKTVSQQINAVKPSGWTVTDRSGSSIQRTIQGDLTPLQICQECTGVYSVYVRWDNKTKTCTIYPKAMGAPVGSFATRELNLKEINYKGKSNDFATRLYAYGKDGLSFNGKTIHGSTYNHPYVDNNTYSSRVICAYWQDDRYTDPESLYDDAVEKLALLAVPERSYDCAIVDLQATNPELYNNLDFSLFTTATLIDDVKDNAVDYQVVERHVWPYHPERNDVIFDNSPQKITTSVIQIQDAIDNPNSTFSQIWEARVQSATDWLLSGDGYVVAVKGADGEWKELLFMDTNDIATAQKVIRINENGIGFSTTGANGPYTNAWTIDGKLNADFILTGEMTANRIKGGTLTLGGSGNGNGICVVNNSGGTEKVRLDNNGIKAQAGYIGNGSNGWTIGNNDIHNGCTGMSNTGTGLYIGTDGIRCNGNISQTPGAWIKIAAGVLEAASVMTAGGFATKSGGAVTTPANGKVMSGNFSVTDDSSEYTGKTTGAFSFTAYVDGQQKAVGLNFMNGILIGVSGF